MLGIIREKASGWIAGIIVGALIISFAFWGVSSYFGGGDVFVASVNGKDINYQTFQRSFYSLRQQMQSMLGGDALTLEEEALIKEQTLQKLVDTELVNQIVADNHLRVTNEKVVNTIKNLEFFKNENGFDRNKYERGISSMGMDPVFFEAQLRMDLLSEQLQAGLSDSLFVLESELNDVLRLKTQTRDLTYSIISLSSLIDDSPVDDAEIESFYKTHPEKFADPEKVKIAYLEVDVEEIAKTISTDEDTLREYYKDNKDKYDVVEQRSVTKLFITTAQENADKEIKEASEEEKANAKVVIESALAMVKEGKEFEEVIEQFTEEGKGALEFSEHAFMAKGIMDEEIDEFLFSSDEGAISDVIETKKGFNIVKVGEIRGGPKNTYESAAEKVEYDYKISQAELQFFELSDQLTTLSYEHSDTLEVAADAIGQQIVESDYFSRKQVSEGVLSNSRVIASSFNPELIASGQNSDAIEISDNHIVVLRVLDHKSATTKPLDSVRDDVIAEIRLERAAKKIVEVVDSIVEQMKSGVPTDSIVSEIDIEWLKSEKTKRDDVEVNRSVLRKAFQIPKPVNNEPVVVSNRLGSGDYSVIMVSAVHDGELVEKEDDLNKLTDLEMRRTRGTNEWQEFLNNVKSNAKISLFKENI
jgi:peptidyl-prolyl cis-trans isomerase D